jgi:hypothetical protein
MHNSVLCLKGMAQQNKITYHNDQTNKHQVYTLFSLGEASFP